jgi:hypothetical protein
VPPVPDPMSVVGRVGHEVERSSVRARNGIRRVAEVASPAAGQTAKEVTSLAGGVLARRDHRGAASGTAQSSCRTCRRSGQCLAIFGALGCTGAAVLHDHIRELVILAYSVDAAWESAETIGVADELGSAQESGKGAPA